MPVAIKIKKGSYVEKDKSRNGVGDRKNEKKNMF